jgi:hypothetical protein
MSKRAPADCTPRQQSEAITMKDNDPVALAELATVLDVHPGHLRDLASGPFSLDASDSMRLRVAFGAAVLAAFTGSELLEPRLSVHVAVEAANGAELGGNKSLLVAWRGVKPAWVWFDGQPTAPPLKPQEGFGSPLRRPMAVVPVDAMYSDLAAAIVALRERIAATTH